MDVLVVATNRYRDPEPVLPLGACLAASAAAASGHAVRLLDLMFEPEPENALGAELARRPPDVVGFSVRNIDSTEFGRPAFFAPQLPPLVEMVRRRTSAEIILGGPAVNMMPEPILRYTGVRWAAVGEAEVVFPSFLDAVDHSRPGNPPGVAQWRDGRFLPAQPAQPSQPDHSARLDPRLQRWVDLRRYRSHLATVPIQTKRGCPFRCAYCTYPSIEGSAFRLRPPEEVAAELHTLGNHGVRAVEVVDSVFNAPLEHAIATWEAVARTGHRVRLQSHTLNPGFVDRTLLRAMEKAGFTAVGITAESIAGTVLEGLGKSYTPEDVQRAAELLSTCRFPRIWFFLLGGPGETMATVGETLAFAKDRLGPKDLAFFSLGIRIYPDTPIHTLALREGLVRETDDLLRPAFYFAPDLDSGEVLRVVRQTVAAEPRLLGPEMAGWDLLSQLRRGAAALGVPPPLWRHAVPIRKAMRWLGIR